MVYAPTIITNIYITVIQIAIATNGSSIQQSAGISNSLRGRLRGRR